MAFPAARSGQNVYEAATEYRDALLQREEATVRDTVRRWLVARQQIEAELDKVLRKIAAAQAAGQVPVVRPVASGKPLGPNEFSASWLYQAGRMEQLLRTIEGELETYEQVGLVKIASRIETESLIGVKDATSLLRFRVRDDGLVVPRQFGQPSESALLQITAQTGPGGPIPKAFRGFDSAGDLLQRVQDRIVTGLAAGQNPNVIGRLMHRDQKDGGILDRPLYEQLRVARTEPARAYREAGRQTYRANADVVEAWEWRCHPSLRTCAYCFSMDGSLHDLDEIMAEHPMGRCTELPVTELSQATPLSGARFLYDLSAEEQDEVFHGHTMGELYRSGKVRLRDMAEVYDHPDWGPSGKLATLTSLQQRGVITQGDVVRARESRTATPAWKFREPSQRFQPVVVPFYQSHA